MQHNTTKLNTEQIVTNTKIKLQTPNTNIKFQT